MRSKQIALGVIAICIAGARAQTQNPPNVSQVLLWSTLSNRSVQGSVTGTLPRSLLSVYTEVQPNQLILPNQTVNVPVIINPSNYDIANTSVLSSALSSDIALALSVIPLSSPVSGVIEKTDRATGALRPASSTLGPIFTQRAETVGKGKFYIGFSHQSYHFTSIDGQNLNGVAVVYQGNDPSGLQVGAQKFVTKPATFNVAADVRLSQDIAFLTFGVTSQFDVSIGLPVVHSAVAATSYNGVIYSGLGNGSSAADQCWCVNTFTPGTFDLAAPFIGRASLSKTGFGDVLLRFKDALYRHANRVLAVGADLRLPSGEAENFLGTGTTSVRPFFALSLFSKPLAHNVVIGPHIEAGWQFSGKSILAGALQPSRQTVSIQGAPVVELTAPFTATKDYIPDVFSWSVGTEIALGNRNTVVLDILGNQIGWIHGSQLLARQPVSGAAPQGAILPMTSGFIGAGRGSFGQYNGSFGYKARIAGNLVASFNALVRFDNNSLTARFSPLVGLGYSF